MPTDTKDTELFELCKEVYEATGWGHTDGDDNTYQKWYVGDTTRLYTQAEWESYAEDNLEDVDGEFYPLYTSDYLLEKLPQSIDAGRSFAVDMFLVLDRPKNLKYQYRAFYTAPSYGKQHEVTADTPLKALLKLTLALQEKK